MLRSSLATSGQEIEQGHSYGNTVGYLLVDDRFWTVSYRRRNFDIFVYRPGVENDGIGFSPGQS
jgi:hypothetical protein